MLILTRRVGETVMIGDTVALTVLGVKGNQVRVGIDAPKNVAVHREEIYKRIKRDLAAMRGEEPDGNVGGPVAPGMPPPAPARPEPTGPQGPKITTKKKTVPVAGLPPSVPVLPEDVDSGVAPARKRLSLRVIK